MIRFFMIFLKPEVNKWIMSCVCEHNDGKKQAENRRKDIEMQLAGSKYGIAYTDGTERITQLNRPAKNNLLIARQIYS